MAHVPYIDRTRDYYRSEGYEEDYHWAKFEDGPFTRLDKPIGECTLALISTAVFIRIGEDGRPLDEPQVMGTNQLEVFPIPSTWPPERLRSESQDHDRAQTSMEDPNAYFPLTRLKEFRDEGVLGALAGTFSRLVPNYSKRKTLTVDAPEVLRRCREEGVDAAILAPV